MQNVALKVPQSFRKIGSANRVAFAQTIHTKQPNNMNQGNQLSHQTLIKSLHKDVNFMQASSHELSL